MNREPEQGSLAETVKTYAPLLALALPAMVFARGPAAREIGNLLKKFAPQHWEKAVKSPAAHFITTEATPRGPTFTSQEVTAPKTPEWARILSGAELIDWPHLRELAKGASGKDPSHLTRLNVPTAGPDAYDVMSGGMHEFGHLSGWERARERFPNSANYPIHELGSTHLDIMDDPKTRAIIQSGLKDPKLRAYLEGRLATRGERPAHDSLGEYLTELWSRRILQKGGYPHKSVTDSPIWRWTGEEVEKARRNPASHIPQVMESVAQTGQLPLGKREEQLKKLDDLLRMMQGNEDRFKRLQEIEGRARPSPPAPPSGTGPSGASAGPGQSGLPGPRPPSP